MNKLGKFCVVSLLLTAEIFGMEMQLDTVYRVVPNGSVMKNLEPEKPAPTELAVLTLVYRNNMKSTLSGKSRNYDFLQSVESNAPQLREEQVSTYLLMLIMIKMRMFQ